MWSVRVDEKLLKQAKPVLKAKFGSDCRGVETWLAGLVATTKGEQLSGVYPSNTVEIGNLIIERNLRPRRKLVAEIEEVKKVTYKHEIVCGYCDAVATWEVEPNSSVADRRVYACDVHYSNLLDRRLVGDSKHLVAKEAL